MFSLPNFTRRKAAAPSTQSVHLNDESAVLASLVGDRGFPQEKPLPIVSPQALEGHYARELSRIRALVGVEADRFNECFLPAARFVFATYATLPVTPNDHHRFPLGAVELAIRSAMNAAQASAGTIFEPRANAEVRMRNEPRWRLACALAALTSDLFRSATDVNVVDHGHRTWIPYDSTLYDWARANGESHFYLRWSSSPVPANRRPPLNAFFATHAIPSKAVRFLREGSDRIVSELFEYLAGADTGQKTLSTLLTHARAMTITIQLETDARNYGRPVVGIHLEPLIIESMRILLRSGRWRINTTDAMVYVGSEGTYLRWPESCKSLAEALVEIKVSTTSFEPDAMLKCMLDAKIAIASGEDVVVSLPVGKDGKKIALLEITSERVLFPEGFPGERITIAAAKATQDRSASGKRPTVSKPPNDPRANSSQSESQPASQKPTVVAGAATSGRVDPSIFALSFVNKFESVADKYAVKRALDLLCSQEASGSLYRVERTDVWLLEKFFAAFSAMPQELLHEIFKRTGVTEIGDPKSPFTVRQIGDKRERCVKLSGAVAVGLGLVEEGA